MGAQNLRRRAIIAALLLLLTVGGIGTSMDTWREHNSRRLKSLQCCTHIDDVSVAAHVDPSELGGVGAEAGGVFAPSPSGECMMHIRVRRARLSAMYAVDGRLGAGLLIDLDVHVRGPSPRCDGSFAHLKVWDSSNGVAYRSAFSYWGGWLNITTVDHAAAAPPDQGGAREGGGGERLRQYTIVLPAKGPYWLEVMYDSEMYTGFLDRDEGLKLSPQVREMLQPARTVFDPWLDIPAACFNKAIPASSPGCDCDARRSRMYQSWPGYWAENRTVYVPFFHPRVTRWAAPHQPSDHGLEGGARVNSSILNSIMDRAPGGMMIIGTSRQRTLHFDILDMIGLGGLFKPSYDALDLALGWKGNTRGTRIGCLWQDIGFGFEQEPNVPMVVRVGRHVPLHGRLLEGGETYQDILMESLDRVDLCTRTSMRSVLFYNEATHAAARVLGPRGLLSAVSLVNKTLSVLAQRCRGTKTTLMVASEMAMHDHWPPGENSFRDNRIVGINNAIEEIAHRLELPFLDMYPMSLSADVSPPYKHRDNMIADTRHYWSGMLVGDQVSRVAARAYLDAMFDNHFHSSDRCSMEMIEPFDGQMFSCGRSNRRNVSVIVAAPIACTAAGEAAVWLAISVNGELMPIGTQSLAMTREGTNNVMVVAVVELGEGKHVVSAACSLPGCKAAEVSNFEVMPGHDRYETETGTAGKVETIGVDGGADGKYDDDDDDDVETTKDDDRCLAVMLCSPPLEHAGCINHAGRVMHTSVTAYDILLLSSDCSWAEHALSLTRITQWRLREWLQSLHGISSSLRCLELPHERAGPADSWPTWFDLLGPGEMNLSRYHSLVLISQEWIQDLMTFRLSRVRGSMQQAGAHVAMPSLIYDSDEACSIEKLPPEHQHDSSSCVRWTSGNSLPIDPPILVVTATAWECAWRRLAQHNNILILPHLSSVLCSPRGALSACNMSQSCILVDHSPVKVFTNSVFGSLESLSANEGTTGSASSPSFSQKVVRPYPYGVQKVSLTDDCL